MDRFWSKVDKSGGPCACWPWTAGRFSKGYGAFRYGDKVRGTHVVALELETGEDADGRHALHSCDNPACCNPTHLRWGSNQDNVDDKMVRGRHRCPKGAEHPSAKLSEAVVTYIRERHIPYSKAHSATAIARDLGLSQQHVSAVVNGRRWA